MEQTSTFSGVIHRDLLVSRWACRLVGVATFTLLTTLGAYARVPLPFTSVPITLQTLFVLGSGAMLGSRLGLTSQLCYVMIGALGMPVFSGGSAGHEWLLWGPTGGYILSFPIASWAVGRFWQEVEGKLRYRVTGMLVATAVVYLLGSVRLASVAGIGWRGALLLGVAPFIAFDLVKLAIAAGVSQKLLRQGRRIFQV